MATVSMSVLPLRQLQQELAAAEYRLACAVRHRRALEANSHRGLNTDVFLEMLRRTTAAEANASAEIRDLKNQITVRLEAPEQPASLAA
jgi:hypothetical protein